MKLNIIKLIFWVSFIVTSMIFYVTPIYWLGLNKQVFLCVTYMICGTITFLSILFYFIYQKIKL